MPKEKQFFSFAKAYLEASSKLCKNFDESDEELGYPSACVVLFLAHHAVELFLKGAILNRSPDEKFHLRIEELKETFDRLYPEVDLSWDMPFRTEYLGFSPEEREKAKKDKEPVDQVYRYPTDKERQQWQGIYAFEPASFQKTIESLLSDFTRLELAIDAANKR
ncbi:MAG: hypothetical protein AB1480_07160 [Nitrospirota bacterium]